MTIYYSGTNRGFYNTDINKVIPDDAVEVSEESYNDLLAGQQLGREIVPDDNGYPVLTDIPVPTAEQNKDAAMQLLKNTDWVNQPDVRDVNNNPHLLNGDEFDAYRVAVRQYAVYPVAGNIDFPELPKEIWSS